MSTRTCSNCAHCKKDFLGSEFDKCLRAGFFCSVAKKYNQGCDFNLSGHEFKEGLIQRVMHFFYRIKND